MNLFYTLLYLPCASEALITFFDLLVDTVTSFSYLMQFLVVPAAPRRAKPAPRQRLDHNNAEEHAASDRLSRHARCIVFLGGGAHRFSCYSDMRGLTIYVATSCCLPRRRPPALLPPPPHTHKENT